MKTVLVVEQCDDLCINKDGVVKVFLEQGVLEINKETAYELGIFLYRVLDLLAPEVEEETEEETVAKK